MDIETGYAEKIKQSLEEADLDFKGQNSEFERLWLEGYGSLSDAVNGLPKTEEAFSDDEKFFLLLLQQAMEGLYDMYLSLRRRRYTAVRRDIRFVYEAVLLLDKSVADPEWASEIQNSFRKEASQGNTQEGIHHSARDTTQKISDKAGELHGKLAEEEDSMGKFAQLLGVSGSHPYNFQSMDLNGEKRQESELTYLTYGLNFAYGLMGLFLMKFKEDKISDEKFQEMMGVMREQMRLTDDETFIFIWYFSDFAEEIAD